MMDPRMEDRATDLVPEIPLTDRRLINEKSLRDRLEIYSGVQRSCIGQWKTASPTMTWSTFATLVNDLKLHNHRALAAFIHATNCEGILKVPF